MYECECGEVYDLDGQDACPTCGKVGVMPDEDRAPNVGDGTVGCEAGEGAGDQDAADQAAFPDDKPDVPEGGYQCCGCKTVVADALGVEEGHVPMPAQPTDAGPVCPRCLAQKVLDRIRTDSTAPVVCSHCNQPSLPRDAVYVQVHAVEADPGVVVPAVWPLHGKCVKPTAEPDASNMLKSPEHSLGVAAYVSAPEFRTTDDDLSE